MSEGVRKFAPPGVVLAIVLSAASNAASKEPPVRKSECASAYEAGQRYRHKGQLKAARQELLRCARRECPQVLVTDCTTWLDEVEAALPTVVPAMRTADGRDVVGADVWVDDEQEPRRVDGTSFALDPGLHRFRFTRKGREDITRPFVARESEKSRPFVVVVSDETVARDVVSLTPMPTPSSPGNASAKVQPEAQRPATRVSPAVYVFGGIGAAALSGFLYFGVRGLQEKADLQQCSPGCPPASVDAVHRRFIIADTCLAAGTASLAVAAYFFFARPSGRDTGLRVWPSIAPSGGFGGSLQARF